MENKGRIVCEELKRIRTDVANAYGLSRAAISFLPLKFFTAVSATALALSLTSCDPEEIEDPYEYNYYDDPMLSAEATVKEFCRKYDAVSYVDSVAYFEGTFKMYFENNFVIPKDVAKRENWHSVDGEVIIVLDTDGSVLDVKVQSYRQSVVEYVEDFVRKMPKWHPASNNGEPVRFSFVHQLWMEVLVDEL